MVKYVIKLEINGIEFQIQTLAGSEREAKDNAWEVIRNRTSFLSIQKDQKPQLHASFSSKLAQGIKSALLF